ncbi:alpha/beta hydrolase family protein [Microlunatus parietis]
MGSAAWRRFRPNSTTPKPPSAGCERTPQDPGITAVLDALFGGPASRTTALRELASPRIHVTPSSAPFLIIHGARDETVPVRQARAMAETLRQSGVPVTLHEIEGVFHNLLPETDVPWGTEPWSELAALALAFFQTTLPVTIS